MILTRTNNFTGEKTHFAVKMSKRGNSVYVKRTLSKFLKLSKRIPNITFFKHHDPIKTTKALFLTLTYDTKLCNFREAWEKISEQYNLFMSNMRKQYGKIATIRCFEAFENGHPHIHAILLFQEKTFNVISCVTDKGKHYWGVKEGVTIDTYWHSNVMIQAVDSLDGAIRYLFKYLTKSIEYENATEKTLKTLALGWVFNKRAFSVTNPENILRLENVLIQENAQLKPDIVQKTLTGEEIPNFSYILVGFVSESILFLTPEEEKKRTVEISQEVVDEVYKYLYDKNYYA